MYVAIVAQPNQHIKKKKKTKTVTYDLIIV
jgi:hypothetical protein